MSNTTKQAAPIDIETAKARVIERLALQEVEADRARIQADEGAKQAAKEVAARKAKVAALAKEKDALDARVADDLDTCAEHLRGLLFDFRELTRAAGEERRIDAERRSLLSQLGQPDESRARDPLDAHHGAFASTLKRVLREEDVSTEAFFAWVNRHAVLWA